jgi:maltose alpha-D-glucosyltransferase/alpha-amylase
MGGFNVVAAMVRELDKSLELTIPVAIHLDHGSSIEVCKEALKAGFTSDFVLDHRDNFTHYLARSTPQTEGLSVLDGGDQRRFIENVLDWARQAKENNGYISMISGNHDCPRIDRFQEGEKLSIFYMMMYTLPGVPFLYYGDEIGMKHRNLASKEGGYQRTGDRTPMQWNNEKNRGFSTTDRELYLPVDDEECNVEEQLNNPDSLLNFLKELLKVRKGFTSLSNNNIRFENTHIENVYVLTDFVGEELEIFNPYGGSLQSYGLCYESLRKSIKKLVKILN